MVEHNKPSHNKKDKDNTENNSDQRLQEARSENQDTHEGKENGKQMSQESKVKENKDENDSIDQRSQERNGTDNKEEEEEISTSLSSRLKDCEGINLVVDLNCENDKQKDDFEGNSDDEVAESLIQFFAPNIVRDKEEGEVDEDQECTAESHLKEVIEKQGLSPVKRGRSKHKGKSKKLKDARAKTVPLEKGKSLE
ncbi:uncharacterized protein LOC132046033 [Lycium ferocissimum]|uniref:uncharacterized protein LOC132046033 n=1 Tax=Lycium ferocissimum TaxID=112874 RepID=UPI0028156CE8|nr:uncharacterized protein LOC132046033 [Lycium ferocissimum]